MLTLKKFGEESLCENKTFGDTNESITMTFFHIIYLFAYPLSHLRYRRLTSFNASRVCGRRPSSAVHLFGRFRRRRKRRKKKEEAHSSYNLLMLRVMEYY